MTPSSFLKLRKNGPILFDGAMGTLLHGQGTNLDRCFEIIEGAKSLSAGERQAVTGTKGQGG
jgi:hypothetical protein